MLDDQRTLSAIDDGVDVVETGLVHGAVAFTYAEEEQQGLEVWYRVDQFLINEFVFGPGPVGDADLRGLHDAVAALVGP